MADPLYRRIADDLRAQIETGQFEPGSQLPSEEKLGEIAAAGVPEGTPVESATRGV